ncbi:MAG TPA: hypothetical protein VFW17_03685 [Ktedonobacterales bacterium]|nr:hypothetical protein [Ktedonobacterales bacterium]
MSAATTTQSSPEASVNLGRVELRGGTSAIAFEINNATPSFVRRD